MTTYRDLLLRKGKESPFLFLSQTYQADPAIAAQVWATLASGTDPAIRQAVRANPTLVPQFLVAFDGKIFVATNPIPAVDNLGNPVVLASLSDTLGQTTPVTYQNSDFERYFTSLVPLSEAETFSLPIGEENPDDLDGPVLPPVVDPAGGPPPVQLAPEAPSMARLNFGAEATTRQPRIVALPVFLPLIKGCLVPNGHPLDQELPSEHEPAYAYIAMWRKAMLYCIQQNSGRSVTRGGRLFDITNISLNPFANTPVVMLVQPTAVMLLPHTPQFATVVTSMQVVTDEAYIRMGSNMALDPAANLAPGVPTLVTGGFGTADMVTLINSIKQAPVSMGDKELADDAVDVENRFRLICATIQHSDNPAVAPTVTPGEISDPFRQFLRTKNKATAHRQFRENLETSLARAAESDGRLSGLVTFQADSVDETFTRCMKTASLMTDSLNHRPEQAKQKLSMMAFASPPRNNPEYLERLKDGQLTYDLALRGEEAKGDQRKITELFVGGQMTTGADIQALIANTIVVMSWCVKNFTSTHWCQQLLKYEALLKNNSKWCQHQSDCAPIGYNCVNDIHDISAMYFAVGNQAMYRQAIANGDAINAAAWTQAMGVTDQILMELRSTMQRFTAGKYGDQCRLFLEFYRGPKLVHNIQPRNLDNNYQRDHGPNKRLRTEEPPARPYEKGKKGKPDHDPPSPDKANAGFLNWVAPDDRKKYPAPCPITYAASGKSDEKICIRFITVGQTCGYGLKCNFHHPKAFHDIPDQAQLLLTKYVNNTKGLSFVPGKGPKST